jgi:hypothetical protein
LGHESAAFGRRFRIEASAQPLLGHKDDLGSTQG